MRHWLAPLIVGAFWLAILLIGMAGATVHTIVCAYPPPCVECSDIAMDCQENAPCLYDDVGSWTGWASHGTLCPPQATPRWQACMFQFRDDGAATPTPRSVFAPDCTCDGRALPCQVESPPWWCVGSWMPGC